MKIYISHSREFDYKNELYAPIRNSIKGDEIFLPHEENVSIANSREFYKSMDIIIAECSYSSVGLGIELGWAYDDQKTIYCIYKKDKKISNSITAVTNNIIEYIDEEDMIKTIEKIIDIEKNKN